MNQQMSPQTPEKNPMSLMWNLTVGVNMSVVEVFNKSSSKPIPADLLQTLTCDHMGILPEAVVTQILTILVL